jgi:nucleoside-diphosphate-sugar epimerase
MSRSFCDTVGCSLKRVLVTGAGGFVGSALCGMLAQSGYLVRATGRRGRQSPAAAAEQVVIGDLGADLRWQEALAGVDLVVHLAARTHILGDSPANLDLYREANALGTLNLARQSAAAGVRQFVFLSSVKVNGEATASRAFTSYDEPQPQDAYGVSKWEGEKFLMMVGRQTGMGVAIIRSPLVYGPGVKANFLRLMRWIDKEIILPLGAVHNRRSLVSVWNLCDLILRLLARPTAPAEVWMVSDGQDVSTPELIRHLASAMNRRARLVPVPVKVLEYLGWAFGYRAHVARLCGSLAVDITNTRTGLDWFPPVSVTEGLQRTAHWYLSKDA